MAITPIYPTSFSRIWIDPDRFNANGIATIRQICRLFVCLVEMQCWAVGISSRDRLFCICDDCYYRVKLMTTAQLIIYSDYL